MLEQTVSLLQVPGGPELLIIGFIFLVGILGFLVWVGLAYWVYRDANRRNMDNALLWGVITLVLGLVGVVIYLLVRE
ncbi:MAG: hypothetical protein V5A44_12790 [Haloarculaceae archaeon]